MRKLAALPLLLFPFFAFADCTNQLQGWAKALHPSLVFDSEHAVCKVNPADPQQVLAALTFTATAPDAYGEADYGLEVLVADAANGKVIAHHFQSAAITSDGIMFDGLQLDTARYQLAPKTRAFGVRVSYRGSSRINPYGGVGLSLYVLDGTVLRRVMNQLAVSKSSGDWDGQCVGDFSDTTRTLSMDAMGKKGFAGLVVEEKADNYYNELKGDACESIDTKPVVKKFTLDYDGDQYGVTPGLGLP